MVDKLLKNSLEDNVLTALCWHPQASLEIALQITPDLFSTRAYQRIAEHAIAHIERFRTPPGIHIRDYLETDLRRSETGAFIAQILGAMDELREQLQGAFVQADLDAFIEKRRMAIALETASDLLDKNELERARESLTLAAGTPKLDLGPFLNDTERWLSFVEQNEVELISSGVDILDEHGVHPAPKELYLMIGSAKSGKSWHLIQIGKRAVIEKRLNVLHVTLENSTEITCRRYTQALLGLTTEQTTTLRVPLLAKDSLGRLAELEFDQINPGRLADISRTALARQLRPFQSRGRLLVQEFATLSVSQLSNFLDLLDRKHNFRPQLLILDYADLMDIDPRNFRISLGRVFRDLRALAKQRNLALATVTQGNKSSASSKLVTAGMVAEDWSKIGTADTVVTYSQTPSEREMGLARLMVAAARNARDRWIALITQNYATGQFCLDSVFFSKAAERELTRHLGEDDGDEEDN